MEEKKEEKNFEVQASNDEAKVATANVNGENETALSDDELYAKIETEKLLKKKKTKKIVTLSSLCAAMVLAIVVIILAAVPVSLRPRCLNVGFDDVTLFSGSSTSSPAVHYQGDEQYAKFLRVYDKAFSQSYLSALFSGSLNNCKIDESYTKVTESNLLSSIRSAAGGDRFVRLRYNDEQTFTNQNGKVYHSRYSNSVWDGTLKFSQCFVVVSQSAGLQNVKIIVVAEYPTIAGGEITGSETCLINVSVKGDTSVIYNAWSDLT